MGGYGGGLGLCVEGWWGRMCGWVGWLGRVLWGRVRVKVIRVLWGRVW